MAIVYGGMLSTLGLFYCATSSTDFQNSRPSYCRRQAFDVGGVEWGIFANQLEMGCDCLGTIHYLDGHGVESTGEPKAMKNVICIHEQDMGILHKHTDAQTGAVTLARSHQAADIELGVRATGERRYDNTVVYEETVPLPLDAESNPRGAGFVTEQKVLSTSTSLDLDPARNRVLKIPNDKFINKTSQKPVAYQLLLSATQMLLSNPSGPYHRRAVFATKPVWVTQHRDQGLWPNGDKSFGFTHSTRPEDFLIMPVETSRIGLKPSGFFDMNAALDIPRFTQLLNLPCTSLQVPRRTAVLGIQAVDSME
ncbi:copper amine oxidase [Aspergillus stella-maris]|uniref:copper amine oxidase n=1 Tax=Aspergillus stella-maris TaxID=1810926 RepID=UPI003CCE31E7